jgi:CelD/BcsL family acetyltransferase involved in cellulose biosynthesis
LAAFDSTDSDQLVGIAPLYLDRVMAKGNVLRLLGTGEVCTDHLSIVCHDADRERVAVALAEYLANADDWDALELACVNAQDQSLAALVSALGEHACETTMDVADACWKIELPATWDDYLARQSKSHRKQLRRAERRVLESDRIVWHPVRSATELETAWPILVDLHQRRRKSLGEPGCFASRPFHEFHRLVAERLLVRGQLRMSWLELDGTPAAAEYHFASNDTTYAYQGGVDPERLDDEPGRLSTILCLRQAFDEGHTTFDFLRGDEPYKAHWRAEPDPTVDYRVVPDRRLARLRGRLVDVAGTVSDWIRTSPTAVVETQTEAAP